MDCKIQVGREALMRGKTQKRAGGLLNTAGGIFYEHCECHVDGKYYNP
jgi:hypothetical protein